MKLNKGKSSEPLLNINRLQQMLEKFNLDIIIASTPSNVQYTTGFRPVEENTSGAHQTFAILSKDHSDICLIIPQSDIAAYCISDSWANEIEVYGHCYQFSANKLNSKEKQIIEIYRDSEKKGYENILEALRSVLYKYKLDKCRIGIDELYLDPKLLKEIIVSFPKAEIKNSHHVLSQIRAVKTSLELVKIKESIRITEEAIKIALTMIKPLVSEAELASILQTYIVKQRAFPILWYVGLGQFSSLIDRPAFSLQGISAGDWIMFDVDCRINGYCSDLARSYIYRKPSER